MIDLLCQSDYRLCFSQPIPTTTSFQCYYNLSKSPFDYFLSLPYLHLELLWYLLEQVGQGNENQVQGSILDSGSNFLLKYHHKT